MISEQVFEALATKPLKLILRPSFKIQPLYTTQP
jgi:hypothetical protein